VWDSAGMPAAFESRGAYRVMSRDIVSRSARLWSGFDASWLVVEGEGAEWFAVAGEDADLEVDDQHGDLGFRSGAGQGSSVKCLANGYDLRIAASRGPAK
jgi:hypothetical protein